jgi:hypothetical protein
MFVVTVKWFHRSIFGSYMGSSKMKKKTKYWRAGARLRAPEGAQLDTL